MNANPVNWFEIYVDDIERAKAFYSALFEIDFQKIDSGEVEMWTFPMKEAAAGAAGALIQMDGFRSGGNSTIVYFSCDDCSVEAARAAAGGGSVFKTKFSIGEFGFIALVLDTEGNMIGLHSRE